MSNDPSKLGRPAKGLPRYYMDTGWYRHPRFIGLPPDVLFVFEAAIGYCIEHGLDGEIPGHPEDLAAALGLRASAVKKAVPKLKEREAFLENGDGQLHIRSYADHNPTGDDIARMLDGKSKAGSYGNHIKHHVQKGVTSDDCEHCTGTP